MNYRLVCKLLGIIALLIGVTMIFSLPWAFPELGRRHHGVALSSAFEARGFYALVGSILTSASVGCLLIGLGRKSQGQLYHKEALAVVGLSWLMATVLGALPFYFSGTYRGPAIRLGAEPNTVYVWNRRTLENSPWIAKRELTHEQFTAIHKLVDAGADGIPEKDSDQELGRVINELVSDPDFYSVMPLPGGMPERRASYRILWVTMSFVDAMFESQSGFSTTGATVISDLENPNLIPHCILFWRSSTHFLGGLGIIVLFVVVLGQGSAGKALMRNEVPGPSKEGSQARMQQTAWVFAGIYLALIAILTVLLKFCGLSWFDALCHAFGTMATGGFSTYNASLGHFNSPLIDGIVILFMLLAGMNFTLLYFLILGQPSKMLRDIEWRTYIGVILGAGLVVIVLGHLLGNFADTSGESSIFASARYGLFQVVSIMTTTGYGTHDFNGWSNLGRCILLLLMFVGGCSGSTGGGVKVIRWVLLVKIFGIELERAYHPRVVRPLRIGGKVIEDRELLKHLLVYVAMVGVIFAVSWLFVVGVEPDATWTGHEEHKLLDSASAVAATLNNIGPGVGTVGSTQNYGHFSSVSKLLFIWLMMLGRVEVFAILVLFMPQFWRVR